MPPQALHRQRWSSFKFLDAATRTSENSAHGIVDPVGCRAALLLQGRKTWKNRHSFSLLCSACNVVPDGSGIKIIEIDHA